MKSLFAVLSLVAFSTVTQAGETSRARMEANHATCSSRVNYWHQNFGQYVVSFERTEALQICQGMIEQASCSVSGERLAAGFYCVETSY